MGWTHSNPPCITSIFIEIQNPRLPPAIFLHIVFNLQSPTSKALFSDFSHQVTHVLMYLARTYERTRLDVPIQLETSMNLSMPLMHYWRMSRSVGPVVAKESGRSYPPLHLLPRMTRNTWHQYSKYMNTWNFTQKSEVVVYCPILP